MAADEAMAALGFLLTLGATKNFRRRAPMGLGALCCPIGSLLDGHGEMMDRGSVGPNHFG